MQPRRLSPTLVLRCAAALAVAGGAARAQERGDAARPAVLVVEDLLGDDWKASRAAREEAARLGAAVLPRIVAARAAAPPRADARDRLDVVLEGVVQVLAREVGRPLRGPVERVVADGALGGVVGASARERLQTDVPKLTAAEVGDVGSVTADEPVTAAAMRDRARRARGALALVGPAVTGPLLDVPPLHEPEVRRVLEAVAGHIYLAERERVLAATTPEARAAFLESYRNLADLAAPIVAAGLRDADAAVRAVFQDVRDRTLAAWLPRLDDADPQVRRAAEDALFRLGGLARAPLERVARGEHPELTSPQARGAAARLARRVRYDLSRELVRRLGHDLEGYEDLPFRERRRTVIELERLGGQEAVPALRALLREETSNEVRSVAAVGLFRQGDPVGAEWLRLHTGGVPLRISKRELSAIFMDQGLHYLAQDRYERAIREFEQVLELEPDNEVAWYNLACTYARWGKIDEAIEHLRRAVEAGFDDVGHMEKDRDLDPIRDDPRFKEIIASLEARRSDQ